jgi:putative endonuclease
VGRKFESYLGSKKERAPTSLFFVAMFCIYILYSLKSDKYYIGMTSDVGRRLAEHNDPSRENKYTAKHLPWELKLFFGVSDRRGDALIVERFLKNQKSKTFLEKLISEKDNPVYFELLIENILKRRQLVRAIPSPRD